MTETRGLCWDEGPNTEQVDGMNQTGRFGLLITKLTTLDLQSPTDWGTGLVQVPTTTSGVLSPVIGMPGPRFAKCIRRLLVTWILPWGSKWPKVGNIDTL